VLDLIKLRSHVRDRHQNCSLRSHFPRKLPNDHICGADQIFPSPFVILHTSASAMKSISMESLNMTSSMEVLVLFQIDSFSHFKGAVELHFCVRAVSSVIPQTSISLTWNYSEPAKNACPPNPVSLAEVWPKS
jgi:hypothetical protein